MAEDGTSTAPVPSAGQRCFELLVVDGNSKGRTLVLHPGVYVVGKGGECALVIDDSFVSREHVRLTVQPGLVALRDLGSKNGTFVAGARISEAVLSDGALLRLGRTTLRLTELPRDDDAAAGPTQFGRMAGQSLAMRRLFELMGRVAQSDSSVLIEGETGTGKEVCAEAIHAASARAQGPFVICDLAGINRTLLESELFGHLRGAFTGAVGDRVGLVAKADGGTLFLDEIGELDKDLQTRLLRLLEQHQYKPIGATTFKTSNLRVVAATNRDLLAEVNAGQFRSDLFYRLAVVRLKLPPLRSRIEDVPILVRQMLRDRPLELPLETLACLAEHAWPGNVRELRNTIERALSLLQPGARELPPVLLGLETPGAAAAASEAPAQASGDTFAQARDRMLSTWEQHYLRMLMQRADGNLSKASREAGIERTYLRRLLKRYAIARPGKDDD
jgi:two-component system nitrogen regulation response regulator GlnG